jgi:hypothetical protein
MEADWAVEIGAGAPIIEALWPGFVDLQSSPQRIREIEEAQRIPALAQALLQINHPDAPQFAAIPQTRSQFWTAKCDLWEPDPENDSELDILELDATPDTAAAALACYIDLLPRSGSLFAEWTLAESAAKSIVHRLRAINLQCARADLVVRSATAGPVDGFGITAYLTACGANTPAAHSSLANALAAFTQALSN